MTDIKPSAEELALKEIIQKWMGMCRCDGATPDPDWIEIITTHTRAKDSTGQLRTARELATLKFTIVSTVGGVDYEGFPTSEINFLQRLRILLEIEKERDRLLHRLSESNRRNAVLCDTYQGYLDRAEKAEREVSELNKALALKLDAMPSGLSAGQSKKLESDLATLRTKHDEAVAKLEQAKLFIDTHFRHIVTIDDPRCEVCDLLNGSNALALAELKAGVLRDAAEKIRAMPTDEQRCKELLLTSQAWDEALEAAETEIRRMADSLVSTAKEKGGGE